MKLTKAEAVAKSKNGVVDIPALGAELRAKHGAALNTSGDSWEITGADNSEIDKALAGHDGQPLPVEEPVHLVRRDGRIYDAGTGKEIAIR